MPKRHANNCPTVWLLEILTSFASMACLFGIASIFWLVDGQPLSSWTPGISLNATISILTTACTAAMMHGVSEFVSQHKWTYFTRRPRRLETFERLDEASRGAWGSLKLIFTVGWNLATLGAFITIARLSIAPLTQQVVEIEQRMIRTEYDGATFGFAHAYNWGLTPQILSAESISQDPQMQSAIVQGLYGLEVPAIFSCPGACSWEGAYTSLGFKTECQNVTEATLDTMVCSLEGVSTICNMTTPAGLGLQTQHVNTDSMTSYRMNVSEARTTIGSGQDEFPVIARFAVYRSSSDMNFKAIKINVTDCTLSVAVYEYTNGQANGSEFNFEKTREIEIGGANPWKRAVGNIETLFYTNKSEADGIPALEMSSWDIIAIQNFFTSETIATEWVDGNFNNKNSGLSAALMGDVDLPDRFKKLAASMTDYLRAGPNSQSAFGHRTDSVPFVRIHWYWLIGPVVTEVALLVFAVVIIVRNWNNRKVPVWKSSALAVLACQHHEVSGTIHARMQSIKELMRVDGKKEARLEPWQAT